MVCARPERRPWIRRSLLCLLASVLTLTPGIAAAQQSTSHVSHPSGVVHPAPAPLTPPARANVPGFTPRAGVAAPRWPIWSINARRLAIAPGMARGVQSADMLSAQDPLQLDLRAPIFFSPFFFDGAFPGGFGYEGSVSRLGGMPLGFGLWPACDSAGTPGVFWTVGPCFGLGDYSAESAAATGSEYPLGTAPPSTYLLPLIFPEEPAGPSAQQNPSAPAPAPTMVLYMADGTTISAKDWWVAHGRLQYITDTGATGSADLSQFDVEQTIKQNETRGLDFHMRFTAPSDR
jgi:hypothetical protein